MTTPDTAKPRETPLRGVHERLGATMTGFAGWLMPLRYRSETAEHQAVRSAAGLFDLSHMGEISVSGPGAATALDYALVGHLSAVPPGRARYTMICAADGGILDDLIVYRLADEEFLVVANAANTDVVRDALRERAAGHDAQVTDQTAAFALIAIQGPAAAGILAPLTDVRLDGVKYYASHRGLVAGREVLLARTGYTGEDGFELFSSPEDAERIWATLTDAGSAAGLVPAGLAARDTLRLEAGMPLYGNELGPDTTPFDAGLGRVVKLGKPGDFVGRAALAAASQAPARRVLVGLRGATRRVPRHGYAVLWDGRRRGTVTSGAPSPTLGVPIAMAYVDPEVARLAAAGTADDQPSTDEHGAGGTADGRLAVDVRGRAEPALLTPLPFYHRIH
ncbi:MAG TPA: glycine cleavage system aminomethyltransferase GcvT [Streptosporangiaceae bacterium]|nr:glycine cleavage system aminomethyltransferase GcvT [Streptosporangiaceae bacterium]